MEASGIRIRSVVIVPTTHQVGSKTRVMFKSKLVNGKSLEICKVEWEVRKWVEHKMLILLHSSISTVLLSNSDSLFSALPLSNSSLKVSKTHLPYSPIASFVLPTLREGIIRRKWRRGLNKSVENQSVTVVVESAAEVVRNFYGGINAHDVDSVQDLISENCVYEDLVFPLPFVGRKEILEFFKKFTNSTSTDLQFVIDDLSTEDSSSVGVIWHLGTKWKGKPFPFSKGCSFYRLEVINGKRQITYGRDSVEPAIKPGDATLAAIRSVTWLLQQFPQLADRL